MSRRVEDFKVVALGDDGERLVQVVALDNHGALWSLLDPADDDTPDAWERLPDLPQDA